MPIYVYECRDCQKVFEHLTLKAGKPDEPYPGKCPECGGENLKRLPTTANIKPFPWF